MFDADTVGETFNEQECFFVESVKELQEVNKQLAKLLLRKEELTQDIITSLDHVHEGQKTYEYGAWKIEVKTGVTFSLDKDAYELISSKIPDGLDPVKKRIAYDVSKAMINEIEKRGNSKELNILSKFLSKKPSKPSISIKERV